MHKQIYIYRCKKENFLAVGAQIPVFTLFFLWMYCLFLSFDGLDHILKHLNTQKKIFFTMFQILHIKYKTVNIANVHVIELLE